MRSTCRHHRRGPGSPAICGSARSAISSAVAYVAAVATSASDFSGRAATGSRGEIGPGLLERRQRRVDAVAGGLDGAQRPLPQRRRSGRATSALGWRRRQRRTIAGQQAERGGQQSSDDADAAQLTGRSGTRVEYRGVGQAPPASSSGSSSGIAGHARAAAVTGGASPRPVPSPSPAPGCASRPGPAATPGVALGARGAAPGRRLERDPAEAVEPDLRPGVGVLAEHATGCRRAARRPA